MSELPGGIRATCALLGALLTRYPGVARAVARQTHMNSLISLGSPTTAHHFVSVGDPTLPTRKIQGWWGLQLGQWWAERIYRVVHVCLQRTESKKMRMSSESRTAEESERDRREKEEEENKTTFPPVVPAPLSVRTRGPASEPTDATLVGDRRTTWRA